MALTPADQLAKAVANAAIPMAHGGAPDRRADVEDGRHSDALDALMEEIGDARVVLLGEATHGTHEFYRTRASITQRLIQEKGFRAVAIEGDFPDAARAHRWVRARTGGTPDVALSAFLRFPQWMWRNHDMVSLVRWLRDYNLRRSWDPVGFYGIDLYSLFASIAEVLTWLDGIDPAAASRARENYACFENFGLDAIRYGRAASLGISESCETEVVRALVEMQTAAARALGSVEDDEERFFAEQNAKLVIDAERYYRTTHTGSVPSWNLRDRHMADTLDALLSHLESSGQESKVVVWAHNSHVGDARATDQSSLGELNLGQLMRERHGRRAFLLGFTTRSGTVTAARDWGEPAQRFDVSPALADSYEDVFHRSGVGSFLLPLRDPGEALGGLREARLHRAIGVVYRPQSERGSHYYYARLPSQFDAVIHFDETHAVRPLETVGTWDVLDPPETWPAGV